MIPLSNVCTFPDQPLKIITAVTNIATTGAATAEVPESQIAAILEFRYGDGLVYLPRHLPTMLLDVARSNGFIDGEGYLTRKGRALIARYHYA
jgi:hypothetical protein